MSEAPYLSFLQQLVVLVDHLKDWKRVLLAFMIAGTATGVSLDQIRPKLIGGEFVIQVGKVGNLGGAVPSDWPRDKKLKKFSSAFAGIEYFGIEPGYRMLMTTEELYRILTIETDHRRARRGLSDPPYIDNFSNLEGNALKIHVRGNSVDQATKYMNDLFKRVIQLHEPIYTTAKSNLETHQLLAEQLIHKINIRLENQVSTNDENSLSENILLERLLNWKYRIDRALEPNNTYPTHQVGKQRILHPKNNLWLFAATGLFVGTIIGLLTTILIGLGKSINQLRRNTVSSIH